MSGRDESVMGSEEAMEGSGGKKVIGNNEGCADHFGMLEGHDEEVSCYVLYLPVEIACLARVEG
ncbi:hypothetical protein KI387_028699, partial [Taxus chinensis]